MDKPIIEYKMVTAGMTGEFNERVAALINSGYEPYGNPFYGENCHSLFQAMVKREK